MTSDCKDQAAVSHSRGCFCLPEARYDLLPSNVPKSCLAPLTLPGALDSPILVPPHPGAGWCAPFLFPSSGFAQPSSQAAAVPRPRKHHEVGTPMVLEAMTVLCLEKSGSAWGQGKNDCPADKSQIISREISEVGTPFGSA